MPAIGDREACGRGDVRRHRGRAVAASAGVLPRRGGGRSNGTATRHRRRPDPAIQAGRNWPAGADRRDSQRRRYGDEGGGNCVGRRRALRSDQMPAAHQGAHRGGGAAWRQDRDRGHLLLDGAFTWCLRTECRGGAGRDQASPRGRDLQGLVALFQRRQHVGRRRAAAQRDRRAGQRRGLGRRSGDRPRRDEGRHRRRRRAPRPGRPWRHNRRRAGQGRGRSSHASNRPPPRRRDRPSTCRAAG